MAQLLRESSSKEVVVEAIVNWEELGIEANRDRRKETRIVLAIPIEVTGFDMEGRFFSDATKTADISERGCSFWLKRRVERGGIVAIKVKVKGRKHPADQRPFLYQVARTTASDAGWVTGAAKLQAESIWFVAFPRPEKKPAKAVQK